LAGAEAVTIRVRRERGYAIVAVAGEIDTSTVTRLRESLFELAVGGRPLVADLDQVSFLDSAGVRALIGAARHAAAHGGSLHVVCARPRIRQVFRLTGLDRHVPLARTLDEALESLAAARPVSGLRAAPRGRTVTPGAPVSCGRACRTAPERQEACSSAMLRKPDAVPGEGLVMVSRIWLVVTGSKLNVVGWPEAVAQVILRLGTGTRARPFQ
jgi:anti-sigma B factor antagonist